MKTAIVYVLVSDENDYYLEQTLISIYTVTLHHSNPNIILIVDNITYGTLVGQRNKISDYCSNIIKVEVPLTYNKSKRSRYLKTKVRELIHGDYLFIDSDTIICSPLDEIDYCDAEIAAVLDNHGDEYSSFTRQWITEKINTMAWGDVINIPHFNSGVFYVKDTPRTQTFYTYWHSYWNECCNKNIYIDQLSLRKTQTLIDLKIKELPGIWNCQIRYPKAKNYLHDAKIIHYQASDSNYIYEICNDMTFFKIKVYNNIPIEIHNMLIEPKEHFKRQQLLIEGKQIDFIQSPMYHIYIYYPTLFNILINISQIYKQIITFLWKFKSHIKKIL